MTPNCRKDWEQTNRHLLKLTSKRSDFRMRLIKYGILPSDYPYTKYQEEISDMLRANDFDGLSEIISTKKSEYSVIKRQTKKKVNKVKKQVDRTLKVKENRLTKVINAGLLEDRHNLETEQHKEIYDLVMNHTDIPIMDIICTYINDCNLLTKQKYLYTKLKHKMYQDVYLKKGKFADIRPEDIIVNEYCPFLGIKIDYRTLPSNTFVNHSHSFDRIVNCKSYVKGNVWIISRLANTMKNEATDDQLRTFCKNVILMYARKANTGI